MLGWKRKERKKADNAKRSYLTHKKEGANEPGPSLRNGCGRKDGQVNRNIRGKSTISALSAARSRSTRSQKGTLAKKPHRISASESGPSNESLYLVRRDSDQV